jgi:hypothetical protein
MRVPPFYTHWQNDPLRDVWHNNDRCPIGQAILLVARLPGTDHVRGRCASCAQLNAAEAGAAQPRACA